MSEVKESVSATKPDDHPATPEKAPDPVLQRPVEEKVPCFYCDNRFTKGTRFCNQCRHYQDFRRHFFFSDTILRQIGMLLPIVAGLFAGGAFVYKNYAHSRTSVVVARADAENIYVDVSNDGWKRSSLRAYRLRFQELPLFDTPLDLLRVENRETGVVPPRDTVRITLNVTGLRAKGVAKDQILSSLNGRTATLEVDVRESNDPEGRWHVRSTTVPAETIRNLLMEKLPDDKVY